MAGILGPSLLERRPNGSWCRPLRTLMLKSLKDIRGKAIKAGEVFKQPTVEATSSARRNQRNEVALAQDSVVQSKTSIESPPPPPTRSKRLRKRTVVEYLATEEPTAAPTITSGTDEELREAFEAIKQEKEVDVSTGDKEKTKEVEEEEEILAEVIAESIALAQQHQESHRAEPTRGAKYSVVAPVPEVKENRTARTLAVVTSPLKPPIVAMPIHYIPGSSTTASFADPELVEFETMDLDAQLDKLKKLNSTPSKAKSKAVDEAVDRVRI
ncbi:unnamed protein product [Prunus armeniaca]